MRFKKILLFDDIETWGDVYDGYQWVISAQGTLFKASYKSVKHRDKPAIFLDGDFDSFIAAEQACRDALRELRNPN